MTGALALVGDLHGRLDATSAVLHEFLGSRRIVFLGDYINRGPCSREVVQVLMDAKAAHPDGVVLLKGNHDQSLLDFLSGGSETRFLAMGGGATIASYVGEVSAIGLRAALAQELPPGHQQFFGRLDPFFETEDLFASHCGPDPDAPADRDLSSVALTSHPGLFAADLSGLGKTVVCGHYVQRTMKPYISDHLIVIDSGCGTIPGAPATALLWPERKTMSFGGSHA